MKRTILTTLFVITIAAVAAWNVSMHQNRDKPEMSDLALANVEALALNENDGNGDRHLLSCSQSVSSEGNEYFTHVTYCGTCSPIKVRRAWDSNTCRDDY